MTNRVKSFKGEKLVEAVLILQGTIYLSKDFPHDMKELMPVFEVLAPTNRHFAKLKDFIQLRFPDYGFPVKLGESIGWVCLILKDLPIFPTMSASVTFLHYEQTRVESTKFDIPTDYKKGKIELLFDFGKKGESPDEEDELDDEIANLEVNDNNQNWFHCVFWTPVNVVGNACSNGHLHDTEVQEEAEAILQEKREEEIVVVLKAEAEVKADLEADLHVERTGKLWAMPSICLFAICWIAIASSCALCAICQWSILSILLALLCLVLCVCLLPDSNQI